ncbi:hypothetical protein MKW98_012342 [Papaver atlanticum]|uniref:Uncharacterized protein n=1 Tax=Papaver atlanticum TaxID=357466 RepID=A0AAD4SZJ5_9MAGN|nr:hypothetical protein MKW98_012342 [Papaver atlanticum]
MAMSINSSSTNSCTSFHDFRGGSVEPSVPSSSVRGSSSTTGCNKIDGVAMWFINRVVAAFFGSLERCSCINIDTKEEDDNGIDANDLPLIYNDGNSRRENRTTIVGSGKKRGGFAHEGLMY